MSRHALLKTSRLIHLYFGVFITPALIFFAFTGAIQTFGLHETNRDHPTYVPARWLVVLGQIHKKQTPVVGNRKPPFGSPQTGPAGDKQDRLNSAKAATPSEAAASSTAPPAGERHEHRRPTDAASLPAGQPGVAAQPPAAPQKKPRPLPLRIFFLIVSIGLFTSTVTGLYMSYKFVRNRKLITATLIAGTIIPILLALL